MVPAAVRVRVPAKINLHLGVGGRRPDGFHELVTVFHAVSLYDEVRAEPAADLSVRMRGDEAADVPGDQSNLVWQAASALAERTGVAPAVALTVTKSIPVAAGLAGGSADAAATLVACDGLWGTGLSRADMAAVAADLGSDVAFGLVGGNALGTGRGEVLSPVLGGGRFHWVLAIAHGGLATPAVFDELARTRGNARRALRAPDDLLRALTGDDPDRLAETLHNDLQAPAVRLAPYLRRTLQAGTDLGALAGIVSGSGPTCAFLVPDEAAATDLAARLAGEGVCRTTRAVSGPVPGARMR